MSGVQLLDKTRKISKLLHNNSSSKVVFNDICKVMREILNQCHLVKGERNVCRFFQRANGQGKWKCQKESRDIFHPVSLRME